MLQDLKAACAVACGVEVKAACAVACGVEVKAACGVACRVADANGSAGTSTACMDGKGADR